MQTPKVLSVFAVFFVFIFNSAYGGYSYEGSVVNDKGKKTTVFKLSGGANGVIIITGHTPDESGSQANAAGNEEEKAAETATDETLDQEEADQEKEAPDKTATTETNKESPQNAASRALSFYSNQNFNITPLAPGWFSISRSSDADEEGTSTSSVYLHFSTTQGEQAPDASLLSHSYSYLTQTDSSEVNREATRTLAATLMNPRFLQQLQEMMRQNPVSWYHPSTTRLGTAIQTVLGRYIQALSRLSYTQIEITEPVSNSELARTGDGYVLQDEENGITLIPQSETEDPRRVFVSLATPGTYAAYANGAVASTASTASTSGDDQKDKTKEEGEASKEGDKENIEGDKESKEGDKKAPEAGDQTGILRTTLRRVPFLGTWLVPPQRQPNQSNPESPNSDSRNDNQDKETEETEEKAPEKDKAPENDKTEATSVNPRKIPKVEIIEALPGEGASSGQQGAHLPIPVLLAPSSNSKH